MNFDFYRSFIAIAEEKSVSRAAARLRVAQPALSAQLHSVEREYGATLVDRRRGLHKFALTAAGEIFLREARRFAEMDSSLRREISDAEEGLAGMVKLSVAPSRAPYFVQRFAYAFWAKFPAVRFEIHESLHPQLIKDVRSGISEIGFANSPLPEPEEFEILFARQEPIVAIARLDSGLIQAKSGEKLPLEALDGVPIAVPRIHIPHHEDYWRAAGITPNIVATTGVRSTAIEFAAQGNVAAIVQFEMIEELPPGLAAWPIADIPGFEKTVIKRRGQRLSAVTQNFLAIYAAVIKKLPLKQTGTAVD